MPSEKASRWHLMGDVLSTVTVDRHRAEPCLTCNHCWKGVATETASDRPYTGPFGVHLIWIGCLHLPVQEGAGLLGSRALVRSPALSLVHGRIIALACKQGQYIPDKTVGLLDRGFWVRSTPGGFGALIRGGSVLGKGVYKALKGSG